MGAAQSGVNLLEWRDQSNSVIGLIDNAGFVGIGANNAGAGFPSAYLHVYSNTAQPAAVFENGAVGIGTSAPDMASTLHIHDARPAGPGTGATRVIIQAGTNQAGTNLLEWQDEFGVPIGVIDNAGFVGIGVSTPGFPGISAYLHVYSNGAQPAAIFENGPVGIGTNAPALGPSLHVVGNGGNTPLRLGNVPAAAATDEVLRIDPATGDVHKSTVAAMLAPMIIRGSFPITAAGQSFTISVAPNDIQPGAVVTVTLVGPTGGTIYPLMVTNIDAATDQITVESSATIPGGAGYAIHYIIINP
jgi:hypothetical protein